MPNFPHANAKPLFGSTATAALLSEEPVRGKPNSPKPLLPPVPDGLLTIDEHRARTRQCRATIYAEIARGELRAVKIGRRTMITAAESARRIQSLPAAVITYDGRSARRRREVAQ